jgi:hypothetical protein
MLIVSTAEAFRISRPLKLSYPLSKDQVNNLNAYLESVWNLQNGEFNFDVQTTQKTNAQNGDVWMLQTGNVIRLQYKANGTIFTITPDGY